MMVTGYAFGDVFGDQRVGGMAIAAICPGLVSTVKPAFINSVHDMAIIAGRGVAAQVGSEIRDIHPNTSHDDQCRNSNDECKFHLLHLLQN